MIRYLIKNNLKLMSRSITNILLLVIMPLILIALLSSAFNDMMKKYEDKTEINAGYRIEGDSVSAEMIDVFKESAAKEGFILREYPSGDPKELVKNEDIDGFVIFKDDTYTIYQSGDAKEEGKLLEYAIGSFYETAASATMEPNKSVAESSVELRVEHPDYMKAIDSKDYYGIIEIVYFGWCAIVCGAGIFMSEKKYQIRKKFQVSNLSETKLYLGKFIPMLLVVSIGTFVSSLLSIVLFGVHWGNPLLSMLIMFFSVAAATALGLMVYAIFDNIVITIIGVFSVVWFAGFFGGSFETYMFSAHPMTLKVISPIYHINRSLVEISCMGHSDYVVSALIYSSAIIIGCSLVAILAGTIRKRGKA